jgi:GGDEF domain-containing protein
MPAASLGRRRPRPVADVPVVDGRELARAWLVELVAVAPLERAAALPGPGFAAQAPGLCEAVIHALSSEAAFDDLEPGGAHASLAADAATLAGADSAAEAVAGLDALRAVTWAALVAALDRPEPGLLADLADRLGAAIATVTAAAFEGATAFTAAIRAGDRGPLAAVLRRPPDGGESDPAPVSVAGDSTAPPAGDSAAPPAEERRGSAPPRPWDPSDAGLGQAVDGSEFHARVAPWTAAVERRLQRHHDNGVPFAVLCVEVADLDRLVVAERDGDVARALEAAEAAVCAQLRPADVLVRERPGRYWLVAPDTDGDAARSLAHLLAAAVAGVPGHRGAPLEAAVGLATCPQDGVDAPALEGRAEEGLFAARASGLRVVSPPRP